MAEVDLFEPFTNQLIQESENTEIAFFDSVVDGDISIPIDMDGTLSDTSVESPPSALFPSYSPQSPPSDSDSSFNPSPSPSPPQTQLDSFSSNVFDSVPFSDFDVLLNSTVSFPAPVPAPAVEHSVLRPKKGRPKKSNKLSEPYDTDISRVAKTREQLLTLNSIAIEEEASRLSAERKLSMSEKKELRRQKRLVKNRESAQASRQRKKEFVSVAQQQLESKDAAISSYENENLCLKSKLIEQEAEITRLRQAVVDMGGTVPPVSDTSAWIRSGFGQSKSSKTKGVVLLVVLFSFGLFFNSQSWAGENNSFPTNISPPTEASFVVDTPQPNTWSSSEVPHQMRSRNLLEINQHPSLQPAKYNQKITQVEPENSTNMYMCKAAPFDSKHNSSGKNSNDASVPPVEDTADELEKEERSSMDIMDTDDSAVILQEPGYGGNQPGIVASDLEVDSEITIFLPDFSEKENETSEDGNVMEELLKIRCKILGIEKEAYPNPAVQEISL